MGLRGQPDSWVAPPKEERLAAKRQAREQPLQERTIAQRLDLANMDSSLPQTDLHGKYREDVEIELDALIQSYPGQIVRIVYGHGTGAIAGEVMNYIRDHAKGKNATIEGHKEDPRRASCVIKVK